VQLSRLKEWFVICLLACVVAILVGDFLVATQKNGQAALVGAQIAIIGTIATAVTLFATLASKRLVKWRNLRLARVGIVAVCGLVIALEGAIFAFSSDMASITGISGQPIYILAIFCAALFFIGMAIFVSSLMIMKKASITSILTYGGGVAAAAEGLVVVGIAAPTFVRGIGEVLGRTIQYLGLQLFLLGLAFVVLSFVIDISGRLTRLGNLMRYLCAVMIAIEGIILAALATPIDVTGIGGMLESTVLIGGLHVAILGLFTLSMCGLSMNPQNRRMRKLALLSALFLALLVPMAVLSAGKIL
jgi:hypothetical protein